MREVERVVFDAEPLIAHATDESGSEIVEEYLDAVASDDLTGYASCVNAAEVRYVLGRQYDRETADTYLDWLTDIGIRVIDAGGLWADASEWVLAHNPALGDAFALATAAERDALLLVGGDDDYDDVADLDVERFRDGSD